MPSDHAAMVGAVTAATWAWSWPVGLAAFAWGLVVACLPRIYFGLDYLSDIAAGLFIGSTVTTAVMRVEVPEWLVTRLRAGQARAPSLVMLGLFVAGWEMIELFWTARFVLRVTGKQAAASLWKHCRRAARSGGLAHSPVRPKVGERMAA